MENPRMRLTHGSSFEMLRPVMSKLIKNSRGFFGLGLFVIALWVFVVVGYARQVKQDGAKIGGLQPLTNESCSSGGNSSSGGEP